MSIETNWLRPSSEAPRTITVYALKENTRPAGFAPWPQPEPETVAKAKRKRKRKKGKA